MFTTAVISKKSEEKARETYAKAFKEISYENMEAEQEQKNKQILDSKRYIRMFYKFLIVNHFRNQQDFFRVG